MLSSDHEIYKKATVDEKRLLLSQLFTNLVQNRYEIKPNYTSAAEYLANWVPKLNRDYELQKSIITKGETGDFMSASPSWLALPATLESFWNSPIFSGSITPT